MATFLFDSIIFGPVKSRRLGSSLGVNLLPVDGKICSFDCIYCECGLNAERKSTKPVMPTAKEVKDNLKKKLIELAGKNDLPDVITFAGNGEPTMHPEFLQIINDTLEIRNNICPEAKVAVLSNSTQIWKSDVVSALIKVNSNILKLDSAIQKTIETVNRPNRKFLIEDCIKQLSAFNGKLIIQTLFCRGRVNGIAFDNTTKKELKAWLLALSQIKPEKVMIYSVSRDTPINSVEKVEKEELEKIATRVRSLGLIAEVS